LLGIGDWLSINGEAIYGTRPAAVFGEGPTKVIEGSFHDTDRPSFTGRDVRYTTRGDVLYAIPLAWPGDSLLRLRELGDGGALSRPVSKVRLLGYDADLPVSMEGPELVVQLPDVHPNEQMPALRIT
jgi:alpha-L-fucosidase